MIKWGAVGQANKRIFYAALMVLLVLGWQEAKAQGIALQMCMERAEAIRITAQVRDRGVSQSDYIAGLKKFNRRDLTAYENEVVTIAYAVKKISPDELMRMAVASCRKYQ